MKLKKCTSILLCLSFLLSGCGLSSKEPEVELTEEEQEINAIKDWFNKKITDEEAFTDLSDYQYYARTIGLEKDDLLSPQMWEIFYNEDININKEIDETAIYLMRLNPDKLLEVWAANNETTADEICSELGTNRDDLYYNFGYTGNSVNYKENHTKGTLTYPDVEMKIFGGDNGEDRQIVFSTHFLEVKTIGKHVVTYKSQNDNLQIRQRDILKNTTNSNKLKYYVPEEFDRQEIAPAFNIGETGIRRLLILDIPNGRTISEENVKYKTDVSVMFNQSPFSYGCTEEDIVEMEEETSDAPVGHPVKTPKVISVNK
ncbi:MAG: hypothetical protein ACI4I1_10385 [Oscillospiraceae bacterium]